MKTVLTSIVFILAGWPSIVGNQSDTTRISKISGEYYTDFTHLIGFKPYLLLKQNKLTILNGSEKLILSPNSPLGIGAGLNYKFGGLAIGLGLPHSKQSIEKYGTTKRLDLQVSLFLKNFGFDGHFQLYRGYYNENPGSFMEWTEPIYPQLPEMRTISFGASAYYVFNNIRYSNKAAVLRTQKQNKSAGSFVSGIFANYDEANSPSGFFPSELPDTLGADFDLKAFRYFATGVTVGYAYTWVINRSFFLNLAIVPGGGYKDVRVQNNAGISDIEKQVHGQLQLRGAFGYENKYFFAGITGSTLIRSIKYKDYEMDLSTEQIRVFVGFRFDPGRKKK